MAVLKEVKKSYTDDMALQNVIHYIVYPGHALTELTLQRLISDLPHFVHIYMSATPWNVQNLIQIYENQFGEKKKTMTALDICQDMNGTLPLPEAEQLVYEFPRDYSAYDVYFYNDRDQLLSLLKTSSDNEKWLYFLNDKSKCDQITKELVDSGISAVCFDADKKSENSKVWASLLSGKMPSNILLTTKVIDNGVSITDDALHHIVIETMDKVSFLQMAGRKRLSANERVNLYFYAPSEREFEETLTFLEYCQTTISQYYLNPTRFLQDAWLNIHPTIRRFFYISDAGHLVLNNFALQDVIQRWDSCRSILYDAQKDGHINDQTVDPSYVLHWLGLDPTAKPTTWIGAEEVNRLESELMNLLDSHLEAPVATEGREQFYQLFVETASRLSRRTKIDNKSKLATIRRFLDDITFGKDIAHPYQIHGKRKIWRITRT